MIKQKPTKPFWTLRIRVICEDCKAPSYKMLGLFEDKASAKSFIEIRGIPSEYEPLPVPLINITTPFKDNLRTWLEILDERKIRKHWKDITTTGELPEGETTH